MLFISFYCSALRWAQEISAPRQEPLSPRLARQIPLGGSLYSTISQRHLAVSMTPYLLFYLTKGECGWIWILLQCSSLMMKDAIHPCHPLFKFAHFVFMFQVFWQSHEQECLTYKLFSSIDRS